MFKVKNILLFISAVTAAYIVLVVIMAASPPSNIGFAPPEWIMFVFIGSPSFSFLGTIISMYFSYTSKYARSKAIWQNIAIWLASFFAVWLLYFTYNLITEFIKEISRGSGPIPITPG